MSNNRSNAKTEVSNFINQVMWFVSSKSQNDIMEATRYLITDEPVDWKQCSEGVLMVIGEIYIHRDSRCALNLYNTIKDRKLSNKGMQDCLRMYMNRSNDKYDSVIEAWEKDENANIIARIYLALEAYAKKCNYNKVLEIYDKYLKVNQQKKNSRLLSYISEYVSKAFYEKKDYASCLNYVYKELAARQVESYDNSTMYEMIAKCGYMSNKIEDILPLEKQPQVKIILAKYYFKTHNYPQAISTLQLLPPTYAHIANQLTGDIYYYQHMYKDALKYYTLALESISTNKSEEFNEVKNKICYYIGRCQCQLHDLDAMSKSFQGVRFSKMPEGVFYKTIYKLCFDTTSLPMYYNKHLEDINKLFANNSYLLVTIILQAYSQKSSMSMLTPIISNLLSNHPERFIECMCAAITDTALDMPKNKQEIFSGNKGILYKAILLSVISGSKHNRYAQKAYDMFTKLINQVMASKKSGENPLILDAKDFSNAFAYAAKKSIMAGHGNKDEVVGFRAKIATIYGIDIGSADLDQLQEISQ